MPEKNKVCMRTKTIMKPNKTSKSSSFISLFPTHIVMENAGEGTFLFTQFCNTRGLCIDALCNGKIGGEKNAYRIKNNNKDGTPYKMLISQNKILLINPPTHLSDSFSKRHRCFNLIKQLFIVFQLPRSQPLFRKIQRTDLIVIREKSIGF